jgi:hypothetical protein
VVATDADSQQSAHPGDRHPHLLRIDEPELHRHVSLAKKAVVSSKGKRNTICFNMDFEGGVYGRKGTTRSISCAKGGAVGTLEAG